MAKETAREKAARLAAEKKVKKVEPKDEVKSKPKAETKAKVDTAKVEEVKVKAPEEKSVEEVVERRKLSNDDEIEIMNNTTGRYGYIGRSGFAMEMTEYGDILEIPFGELKRMRSEQKRHIEDAFIIILDEDAVKELRYEKLYENVFDQESVEDLLKNPAKLAEVLPKMPSAMRETVGSIAIRRFKNNEIFDMRVKKAVEDSLGINIEA